MPIPVKAVTGAVQGPKNHPAQGRSKILLLKLLNWNKNIRRKLPPGISISIIHLTGAYPTLINKYNADLISVSDWYFDFNWEY